MRRRDRRLTTAVSCWLLVAPLGGAAVASGPLGSPSGSEPQRCTAGARTLAAPGSVMYPDTGNGGYVSVHTDVYLRYRAATNTFLPGTHVVLTERATRCLSSFSLDFERHGLGDPRRHPDLQVGRVRVDGFDVAHRFARPTYPGDPYGPNDPDPRAHQVSQNNPVGGPRHNPLPPACSPELASGSPSMRHSQDGRQCPANKLVIVPRRPIAAGATFAVEVWYTGHPGVHHDGDGSSDGWFSTAGGSSMTQEPMGSEDWMPLNNFPTAKPTYDFYETADAGKTVLANGRLLSVQHETPSRQFPNGSATWHWHAPMPIASYLALSIIGDYTLSKRTLPDGMPYYEAQDTHIPAGERRANKTVMDQLPTATRFESIFNGPFPWSSDGVVAGVTGASGDTEEMVSMIVFAHTHVGITTLYHENMHQWWGDNVSESRYELTFFKEGLATLGQVLMKARDRRSAAPGDPDAFRDTLIQRFNNIYAHGGAFWTRAPSKPAPYSLFNGPPTYIRPAGAYLALWMILGRSRFVQTLHTIQRLYGNTTITEPQLEQQFARELPNHARACQQRLDLFFTQWFDTGYPAGGTQRPLITGPGLHGHDFYGGDCRAPGWLRQTAGLSGNG